MNKIHTIYTTVSNGQTHIAADTKYIGSVDSYNNCLTRLLAWIFRQSVNVNFDGKFRSVNKESYQRLLLSLKGNNERIQTVSDGHFFRGAAENGKLPKWNIKMRDVISDSDRVELFHKLAHAISSSNTDKALLMIGKGAALDIAYYDRTGLEPSFGSDTAGLSGERRYKFNVFKGTPILQASIKANKTVVNRLIEAGANVDVTGQRYTFERAIVDIQHNLNFTIAPVIHHHRHGRHVHSNIRYSPRLHRSVTIHTEDTRTESVNYRLNTA